MNQQEKQRVSKGLSDIIDRLESLAGSPVHPLPPWPQIQRSCDSACCLFRTATKNLVSYLKCYHSDLDTDPRTYSMWRGFLTDLWLRMDFLRKSHSLLFAYDYTNMIYHHIFIQEMLDCLPADLSGARPNFILVPSGELVVWLINEAFANIAPNWFKEEYRDAFDALKHEPPIYCFECQQEMNVVRQSVLGHEIFHIIVRKNPSLLELFQDLAKKNEIKTILGQGDPCALADQIQELFCDFAACYYYGPVYLQAFAEEVSFYAVRPSPTHPPLDLRAKFLLASNNQFNKLRSYSTLKHFLDVRQRQGVVLPSLEKLRMLGRRFSEKLEELGLARFLYRDQRDEIARYFLRNMPFITTDVRNFINNFPHELPNLTQSRRSDLVSESLRKSNVVRSVAKYVEKPEALFATPPAISVKNPGDKKSVQRSIRLSN